MAFIVAAGLLALFVALGCLTRLAVDRYALPWAARTQLKLDEIILRAARGFAILWFTLAGLGLALALVPLTPDGRDFGYRVVASLFVFSVTFCAVRILSDIIVHYGAKVEEIRPLVGMAQRVAQVVVWAVGLMMALSYLGVSITPLLTTLGVAGLATALALQDTLANFFAGFYLLADRPIRVGDYIRLDAGDEGYVVGVGWRSTKIRTLPNNIVIVPNERLAKAIVTNYHMPEPRMALLIPVGVSYGSDPAKVERILTEVATQAAGEVDGLLAEPPPFVRFIPGFGDYSLNFTLICQVREFVDQYFVQHELRKRILARFKEEEIEIPFPTRTVYWADSAAQRREAQPEG